MAFAFSFEKVRNLTVVPLRQAVVFVLLESRRLSPPGFTGATLLRMEVEGSRLGVVSVPLMCSCLPHHLRMQLLKIGYTAHLGS